GDDEVRVDHALRAEPVADRAGAIGIVEREQPRLDLGDGEAGHRAGELLRENDPVSASRFAVFLPPGRAAGAPRLAVSLLPGRTSGAPRLLWVSGNHSLLVMAGLVPATHVFLAARKTWVTGTRAAQPFAFGSRGGAAR